MDEVNSGFFSSLHGCIHQCKKIYSFTTELVNGTMQTYSQAKWYNYWKTKPQNGVSG